MLNKNNFKKNIKLLMLFNFLSDFRIYSAFAIIYFVGITKSMALGMMIFSIMKLSSAFGEIPTGIISDIFGRKKTMIIGSFFSIASVVFYAIANNFIFLAVGAVFSGIALSFFSGNNEAFLYDVLANENKEKEFDAYMGKYSSMFEIGMVVSALVGIGLSMYSIKYTFYFSIIPQVICFFISLIISDTKIYQKTSNNPFTHFKESLKSIIKNKKATVMITAGAIDYGATGPIYEMSFAYINTIWPIWALGIYKIVASSIGAFGYYVSGKIIKKIKHRKALVFSNIYAIIAGLIGFFTTTIISPIFIASRAFSFGVGSTVQSDIKQKNYEPKYRSTSGSIDSLFRSIVISIMMILIGILADLTSVALAFVFAQAIIIIVTIIYLKNVKE